MIEQDKPYSMEFQNLRRVHRNRAIGELFAIELEISEEDWHYLSAFPQDAIGQVAIQWTDRAGVPEKQKREAKQKGEFGKFWQKVYQSTILQSLDLQIWLGLPDCKEYGASSVDQIRKALRAKFNTESLTFVSPETAIQAFEQANLLGVATIARRLAK